MFHSHTPKGALEIRNELKYRSLPEQLCLLVLAAIFLSLAGCEDSYGPPRAQKTTQTGASTHISLASEKPDGPTLLVGEVPMPMPAPNGFRRVPANHPLVRLALGELEEDRILLCLFERHPPEVADKNRKALQWRETIQVSTLRKWVDLSISATDFLQVKDSWQGNLAEFNPAALRQFEEAVTGSLADMPEFSYELGKIDSSASHISVLRVIKRTTPDGEVVYEANVASLLWRYGKVLSIVHSKNIDKFEHVQAVVGESVGYLQKLLAADYETRVAGLP